MKRYIKSSSDAPKPISYALPKPMAKYYSKISDQEFEDLTGAPAAPYPCEEADGYDCKHLAWLMCRPKYDDSLGESELAIVELISEANGPSFVGQVIADRVCPISVSEIERYL